MTGIPWISEIIQTAGGDDIFAGRSSQKADQRVVSAEEIVAANPQIILASWCGKANRRNGRKNLSRFSDVIAHSPIRRCAHSPFRLPPGLTALYVDRIDLSQ